MKETHTLKTLPRFFAQSKAGDKLFECRKDDRCFQVGDEVILCEYEPEETLIGAVLKPELSPFNKQTGFSGAGLIGTITYVLHGEEWGIREGYCVFGVREWKVCGQ